ncbi:MAG: cobaltochelatase subunit CobN [Candidatus Omnitrophota bacterium]|jgi:cobaltochelatase CobN|nr:MAG: cobaltochelatase subunit CobN [Candidatus Omnitrophota bacterium]
MKRSIVGFFLVGLFFTSFFILLFQEKDVPGERVRILFLVSDPGAELITKAIDLLYKKHPQFANTIDIRVRAPSTSVLNQPLPSHDMLIAEVKASPWILDHESALSDYRPTDSVSSFPYRRIALGRLGPGFSEEMLPSYGMARDELLDRYWDNGAPSQVKEMISYVLRAYFGHVQLYVESPSDIIEHGLIVIQEQEYRIVDSWKKWEDGVHSNNEIPKVAILEYATRVRRETIQIPLAIAREIANQGLQPVLVFATEGSQAVRNYLIDENGNRRIDAVISMHFKFADENAIEALSALNIPVINAIQIYGRTVEEWRDSTQGLSTSEIAWQLAVPELAGLSPPNVVGGVDNSRSSITYQAIPERVTRAVGRARQWIELQRTSPEQRRVAILYWNYPPGKQNVGASYLNVVRSIPVMLHHLRKAGYTIDGMNLDDPRGVEQIILQRGRNIGKWAPGELDHLIHSQKIDLVSVTQYKEWFTQLPRDFQKSVTDFWGPPEDAEIMAKSIEGELHFILPTIHIGNIILMPQPDRARTQNLEMLYQSQELPPHHQYLAAYLWLQHEFKAHAVVHTGTHGTHEWMSGKESGLSGSDPGEVLAGTLPIVYPYIVDDVGEGIVAKRRGMSTIIDHLTPALGEGGLPPELQKLLTLIQEWRDAQSKDPESARQFADEIEREVIKRGIHLDLKDRGWAEDEMSNESSFPQRVATLEDYINQIRVQSIPYGLHTFGVSPDDEKLEKFTDLIVKGNEEDHRETYRQNLIQSGTQELVSLTKGLNGRYVRPGPGNDPVRNTLAIPTGKNFYTFDPRIIPTEPADELGKKLAEELVKNHQVQHGKYPEKIALQVWGVETIRHMGVQEAQGLALLGVKALRDERGRIKDLQRIPREELGRPRVDVVFHATSLYRDTFPVLVELIDKAVRLAAASPEEDNPIRIHAQALEEQLIAQGIPAEQAKIRSLIRIFAEPTGKHDSKIHAMTASSGSWDKEEQVGNNYIRRMGHGYGGGIWGQPMEREFRSALKGTEAIIHTRASKIYSTLDNDDYFSYGGSIALGVRTVDGGASPPFFVTDLRTPGQEKHETLERFLGQEFRSRYLNPNYANAMMEEGYAGARHVWQAAEYLWGWQVVYPETVGDAKWTELYEVWMKDRYDIKMEEFFEEHNPYARQGISARMLETIRKGYWDAPQDIVDDLTKIYVEQVAKHDVACDHLTCDNPELQDFIREKAERIPSLAPEVVATWIQNVETATGKTIDEARQQRIADRQTWHRPQAIQEMDQTKESEANSNTPQPVEGYVMEEHEYTTPQNAPDQGNSFRFLDTIVCLFFASCWIFGACESYWKKT